MTKSKNKLHIAVAGAGASGMCAALLLARAGNNVTLLEKGKEAGKKLSMTGNGRCNLSNLFMDVSCYHSDDQTLLKKVLARYGVPETVSFFRSVGIPVRAEEGCLYPVSGQAKSVVQALLTHLEQTGVSVLYNMQVKGLQKEDDAFLVRTARETLRADAVVLSCGGLAGPKSTCPDGDGYYLASLFGIPVAERYPALCRIKSDEASLPKETGVRVTARVFFLQNGDVFAAEEGEVQLTKDALSGIPVLQASAACADALAKGNDVRAVLDLFPFSSKEETDALFAERVETAGNQNMRELLNGLSNDGINNMVLSLFSIDPRTPVKNLSKDTLLSLLGTYRGLSVPVSAVTDYRTAQATRGGVLLSSLTENMEVRKAKGLYCTGELVNVDGRCGGYNLQWAWSSAFACADGILRA